MTNTGQRRQIRLLAGSRKAALSRNGTGSAMVVPAPVAAWVSAPILPTRKVPVFVNYLLACTGMEVWNMLH